MKKTLLILLVMGFVSMGFGQAVRKAPVSTKAPQTQLLPDVPKSENSVIYDRENPADFTKPLGHRSKAGRNRGGAYPRNPGPGSHQADNRLDYRSWISGQIIISCRATLRIVQ